eukprot:6277258-Heterocapsa_arctica.AAC.1
MAAEEQRQRGNCRAPPPAGETDEEVGARRAAWKEASAAGAAQGLQAAAGRDRLAARQRTRGGRRPGERRPGGGH